MSEQYLDNLKLYRKDVMNNITTTDIDELCERYYGQNDKTVYDELFNANLHLVIQLARSYTNDKHELLDLIQEGSIGLMKAIELFDYARGYKFATYAKHRILKEIRLYVRKNNTMIKIPNYQISNIYNIKKEYSLLESELGIGNVTHEMVAKNLGMDPFDVKYLFMVSNEIDSLNKHVNDDDKSTCEIADLIEDMSSDTVNIVMERYRKSEINKVLKEVLNEREIFIIYSRFGFNTGETVTYDILGKILCLTKQRVYQIEKAALKKLRDKKYNVLIKLL